MHALSTNAARALAAAALAALVAFGAGCRGERSDAPPRQFLPDMDDQPRWNPQQGTGFFADGRTMRPKVAGTVAFGPSADASSPARADLLKDDPAFYQGIGPDGQPLDWIPQSAIDAFREQGEDTAAAMARMISVGQARYNIYCAVCHNYNGDGKGPVGKRWAYPLPDYHDPKYLDRSQPTAKDGHIFDVIRNGLFDQTGAQKMPAYGHAINEKEAWAIVAYVRTLQESWTTDLEALPAGVKQQLERSRPASAPASSAGQAATQPPSQPQPAEPKPQDDTPSAEAQPGDGQQQQEGGR